MAAILAIPLGSAFGLTSGEVGVPVLWAYVPAALLITHTAFSRAISGNLKVGAIALGLVVATLASALHLPVSSDSIPMYTLGSMSAGLYAGALSARALKFSKHGSSVLLAFLGVTLVQVISSTSGLSRLAAHHGSEAPWGRSNYMSAVVCLAALAICIMESWKSPQTDKPRRAYLYSASALLLAMLIAGTTASWGTAVALAGSILCAGMWRASEGRTRLAPFILALGSASVVLWATWSVRESTSVGDSFSNRSELWGIAVSAFEGNPLLGPGNQAFRSRALAQTGIEFTYPHSIVLSLIVAAGLCAIPLIAAGASRGIYLIQQARRQASGWALTAVVFVALTVSVENLLEHFVGAYFIGLALGAVTTGGGVASRSRMLSISACSAQSPRSAQLCSKAIRPATVQS